MNIFTQERRWNQICWPGAKSAAVVQYQGTEGARWTEDLQELNSGQAISI